MGWSRGLELEVETQRLQDETRRHLLDFLKAELALCMTLASSAGAEHQFGDEEHLARLIAMGERGHETVRRFLGDPKHNQHLSAEERREFLSEADRLRNALDRVRRAAGGGRC